MLGLDCAAIAAQTAVAASRRRLGRAAHVAVVLVAKLLSGNKPIHLVKDSPNSIVGLPVEGWLEATCPTKNDVSSPILPILIPWCPLPQSPRFGFSSSVFLD